ncbi:MAG: hypothetical protein ABIQ27_02720 [Flavobacterium sp.]|uniref:hypothetical protein n=1 Tax=Flavobacterium sp. TaxID=239 RepID=UPI0032666668
MKRIFLLLILIIAAFSINSCSSDGGGKSDYDKATGTISFKVDGYLKTFKSINFHEETYLQGTPDEYIGVDIYANLGAYNDGVSFSFIKGDMDHIYNFTYVKEGDIGYLPTDDFLYTITSNGNDNKLIGAFSGVMGGYPDLAITEGTFNIKY